MPSTTRTRNTTPPITLPAIVPALDVEEVDVAGLVCAAEEVAAEVEEVDGDGGEEVQFTSLGLHCWRFWQEVSSTPDQVHGYGLTARTVPGGCRLGIWMMGDARDESVNEFYLKPRQKSALGWYQLGRNTKISQISALPHSLMRPLFPFPRPPLRRLSTRATMRVVPVPVRQDNYAYLLIDEPSNKAAAVDPYDVPKVQAAANRLGVSIVAAITTHHHHDHSGGNEVCLHLFATCHHLTNLRRLEFCQCSVHDQFIHIMSRLLVRL